MCRSVPCNSAHALELHLTLVHKIVCPLEYFVEGLIGSFYVFCHTQRGNRLSASEILLNLSIDPAQNLSPRFKVLPLKQYNEFVAANPEDRTVYEVFTQKLTGGADVFVAGFVAQGIVDLFETIHITHNDAEFHRVPIGDLCLQPLLVNGKGMLAADTGQRVGESNTPRLVALLGCLFRFFL